MTTVRRRAPPPPPNAAPGQADDAAALFIDCDTGRAWTFAQIRAASVAFGQGLKHALGWAKGDVLATYAPNDVDTPVVNLGLHWAGGVATPANPTSTVGELARQLADSGAKALVTCAALLGPARDAARRVGLPLRNILLLGRDRDASGVHRHWTDLTAAAAPLVPAKTPVDPARDLAFLVYSSVSCDLVGQERLRHWLLIRLPRAPRVCPRASCSRTTTSSPTRCRCSRQKSAP